MSVTHGFPCTRSTPSTNLQVIRQIVTIKLARVPPCSQSFLTTPCSSHSLPHTAPATCTTFWFSSSFLHSVCSHKLPTPSCRSPPDTLSLGGSPLASHLGLDVWSSVRLPLAPQPQRGSWPHPALCFLALTSLVSTESFSPGVLASWLSLPFRCVLCENRACAVGLTPLYLVSSTVPGSQGNPIGI